MSLTTYFLGAWLTAVYIVAFDKANEKSLARGMNGYQVMICVLALTAIWPAIWCLRLGIWVRRMLVRGA